jgi:F420-0:gamma-glutamyl ligase
MMTDLEMAREALLDLIADAAKFEEDVDGDEQNGRPIVIINYDLRVNERALRELAEALSVPIRLGETAGDALKRAIRESVQ